MSATSVFSADPAGWIERTAAGYLQSPANDLGMLSGPEQAFGKPLIGYSAGDDPIWDKFKHAVGEYAWTPLEAFRLFYQEEAPAAGELTVVAWVLPHTEATRKDQRAKIKEPEETRMPAERWVRNRVLAEPRVNGGLRRYLVEALHMEGVQALAPMQLPEFKRQTSEKYVFSSNWSERHVAHAAGLGTFGLCDGLITPVGKSIRVGSIILRHAIPATKRPYTHHQEYCLFYNSGSCNKCIERCPVGAITPEGHDKNKCFAFTRGKVTEYVREEWALNGYGCGFCQISVPCEKRIPNRPAPKGA